jgi:flagellar motility protein MotE (MotC chaperone)
MKFVLIPIILFSGFFIQITLHAQNLPTIPKGELTTSEAMRIRDELEMTKQDIEQKLVRLEEAKKSYDLARLDVDSRLKKVEEEKRLLDETLQKEKKLKEDRVKEAVEFVSKMEPRKVAPVMDTMDRDLVIVLLSRLPPRQVTKLLENSTPAKATQFLEYYTRIRSGREFEMLRELGLCSPNKDKNEEKGNSPP